MSGWRYLLLLCLIFSTSKAMAQRKGKADDSLVVIRGFVLDEDEVGFEQVDLHLTDPDRGLELQRQSNEEGAFLFTIPRQYFEDDSLVLEANTLGYFTTKLYLKTLKKKHKLLYIRMRNKLFPNGYNF